MASLGTVTSTIASTSYAAGVATNHPDLPALITSREVTETVKSYSNLLSAAQRYREALMSVSSAAAEFGAALEDCARCKGAGTSAESLLAAGGLHYLVSNHQQILAKSIQRSFETPVRRQVEVFKATMAANDESFKRDLKERTRQLKKQETENMKLSRMRVRNLAAYRNSLLELTSQIDDIDRLKYEHFCQAFDLAQTTSTNVLTYAASVVRAEVEIYEGIARKGWSGGGLDDLISTCPDPFAPADEDDEFDGFGGGTLSKSTSSATGKSRNLVSTISEFLSPAQSTATTASSKDTIKSVQGPNYEPSSATLRSAAEAQKQQQQHTVKKSTGKGLFSILPSKSILPSLDDTRRFVKNGNASFESDDDMDDVDDDELDYKRTIQPKQPNGITASTSTENPNSAAPSTQLSNPFSTNSSTSTTASKLTQQPQGGSSGGALDSPSSSVPPSPRQPGASAAAFATASATGSPIKKTLGTLNTALSNLSTTPELVSSGSPRPGSSVETTGSTSASSGSVPKPSTAGRALLEDHHDAHGHGHHGGSDSDDMLGYNGWNSVRSTSGSGNA